MELSGLLSKGRLDFFGASVATDSQDSVEIPSGLLPRRHEERCSAGAGCKGRSRTLGSTVGEWTGNSGVIGGKSSNLVHGTQAHSGQDGKCRVVHLVQYDVMEMRTVCELVWFLFVLFVEFEVIEFQLLLVEVLIGFYWFAILGEKARVMRMQRGKEFFRCLLFIQTDDGGATWARKTQKPTSHLPPKRKTCCDGCFVTVCRCKIHSPRTELHCFARWLSVVVVVCAQSRQFWSIQKSTASSHVFYHHLVENSPECTRRTGDRKTTHQTYVSYI